MERSARVVLHDEEGLRDTSNQETEDGMMPVASSPDGGDGGGAAVLQWMKGAGDGLRSFSEACRTSWTFSQGRKLVGVSW
jgi:hypothetical protein